MERCQNKVALVTGGARGIGAGISSALAQEGAHVYISDMDMGTAETLAETLASKGFQATAIRIDVTSEDDWADAVAKVRADFGRLDILVSNAGIEVISPVSEISYEFWKKGMRVNVDGVFLGVKYMQDLMITSGTSCQHGASIVNISSVAGIIGIADQVAYNTSKGAVRTMTKAMAIEFASKDYNIRVNSVHPGCIETNMLDDFFKAWQRNNTAGTDDLDEIRTIVMNMHPLKRLGQVDDIAMGVVYLASDEASFVTGSELVIDGGWVAT